MAQLRRIAYFTGSLVNQIFACKNRKMTLNGLNLTILENFLSLLIMYQQHLEQTDPSDLIYAALRTSLEDAIFFTNIALEEVSIIVSNYPVI